jgi:hypothetical protein
MTTDLRTTVWESWLTAGMNKRYWSYMARRYAKREQAGNVFLAATSSTTVATWAIWKQVEWLWQLTSVISAVISVALPILGYSRLIESMAELASQWGVIENLYESLWFQFDALPEAQAMDKFEEIRKIERELIRIEARLPLNRRILEQCQKEVITQRIGRS